ncbi:membrane fusogenic activity [Ferrovum sp. JA12]|uniref:accessory factor UbiK family protein n=1 Tax=Ferrovum sp. JA12 TaxID=1356299 RepID=UPI00070251A7|nr:accessory factor UbiK family protein [Ferrovum sp. JA12]KRH79445.1 membrane fusogenic activity [Ferrovum sp. JA12]
MFNKIVIDETINQILSIVGKTPIKDIEQNLRQILNNFFSNSGWVTREEFDIQKSILLKTRERLEELEQKINNS